MKIGGWVGTGQVPFHVGKSGTAGQAQREGSGSGTDGVSGYVQLELYKYKGGE